MGYSVAELLDLFYEKETIHLGKDKYERELDFNLLIGSRADEEITDKKGKVVVKKGKKLPSLR
jgi:hypothetical protein